MKNHSTIFIKIATHNYQKFVEAKSRSLRGGKVCVDKIGRRAAKRVQELVLELAPRSSPVLHQRLRLIAMAGDLVRLTLDSQVHISSGEKKGTSASSLAR